MFVVTFYMYIYNNDVFEYLNKYYALSHIIYQTYVCMWRKKIAVYYTVFQ